MQNSIITIELSDVSVLYLTSLLPYEHFDKVKLSDYDNQILNHISGNRRKGEFYTVRWLLSNILPGSKLRYTPLGAPMLEGHMQHISISHCKDFVAILISNTRCGVDIESVNRGFSHIAKRYITLEDACPLNEVEMGVIWSAKEAVFKLLQGEVEGMIEQIRIIEILPKYVRCLCQGIEYRVDSMVRDGIIICYTTY